MASPEAETASTGAEAGFSEAQLKTLAGLMQGMLDKALKDRGQGDIAGGSSSGGGSTSRETPGESGREGLEW